MRPIVEFYLQFLYITKIQHLTIFISVGPTAKLRLQENKFETCKVARLRPSAEFEPITC
jgi:hypothetical protein